MILFMVHNPSESQVPDLVTRNSTRPRPFGGIAAHTQSLIVILVLPWQPLANLQICVEISMMF